METLEPASRLGEDGFYYWTREAGQSKFDDTTDEEFEKIKESCLRSYRLAHE